MRTKAKLAVAVGSIGASLLFARVGASALDHNDGKSPAQDLSSTEIQMASPSQTILGQDFRYPVGVPLLKAFTIEIPAGKQTSLHKHAVPMYVYLTAGQLEVDYGSKGKRTFRAGSSYIEAIDWCHFGTALGKEGVKLLAVYLGQRDPNQIQPEACLKLE